MTDLGSWPSWLVVSLPAIGYTCFMALVAWAAWKMFDWEDRRNVKRAARQKWERRA